MNKLRVTLVAIAALTIAVSIVLAASASGFIGAPALLRFEQNHPVALQAVTLVSLLIAVASMILVSGRPRA
jgi:hypothetical protein